MLLPLGGLVWCFPRSRWVVGDQTPMKFRGIWVLDLAGPSDIPQLLVVLDPML